MPGSPPLTTQGLRHRAPQPQPTEPTATATKPPAGSQNAVPGSAGAGSSSQPGIQSRVSLDSTASVPRHPGVTVGEYREAVSNLQQELQTAFQSIPEQRMGFSDIRQIVSSDRPVAEAFVSKALEGVMPRAKAMASVATAAIAVAPKAIAGALSDTFFLSVTRPAFSATLPGIGGSASHKVVPLQIVAVYLPDDPERVLLQFISRNEVSASAKVGGFGSTDDERGAVSAFGVLGNEDGIDFWVRFEKPIHELSSDDWSQPNVDVASGEEGSDIETGDDSFHTAPSMLMSASVAARDSIGSRSSDASDGVTPTVPTNGVTPTVPTNSSPAAVIAPGVVPVNGVEGIAPGVIAFRNSSGHSSRPLNLELGKHRKLGIEDARIFSQMHPIAGVSLSHGNTSDTSSGLALMSFRSRSYDLGSAGPGRIAQSAARVLTEKALMATIGTVASFKSGDPGLAHAGAIGVTNAIRSIFDQFIAPSSYSTVNELDIIPGDYSNELKKIEVPLLGDGVSVGVSVEQLSHAAIKLGGSSQTEGTKRSPTRKTDLKEGLAQNEQKQTLTMTDKRAAMETIKTTAASLQEAQDHLSKVKEGVSKLNEAVEKIKTDRGLMGELIEQHASCISDKTATLGHHQERLNLVQKNLDPASVKEAATLKESIRGLQAEIQQLNGEQTTLKETHDSHTEALHNAAPILVTAEDRLELANLYVEHHKTAMSKMSTTVDKLSDEQASLQREAAPMQKESDKIEQRDKQKSIRADYKEQQRAKKNQRKLEAGVQSAGEAQRAKLDRMKQD